MLQPFQARRRQDGAEDTRIRHARAAEAGRGAIQAQDPTWPRPPAGPEALHRHAAGPAGEAVHPPPFLNCRRVCSLSTTVEGWGFTVLHSGAVNGEHSEEGTPRLAVPWRPHWRPPCAPSLQPDRDRTFGARPHQLSSARPPSASSSSSSSGAHICPTMPVVCQYFEQHRSTQLFSPTFRSASLYLLAPGTRTSVRGANAGVQSTRVMPTHRLSMHFSKHVETILYQAWVAVVQDEGATF